MSRPVRDEPCFLCGAPAKCCDSDYENAKCYSCSSAECGKFEISNRAIKELSGSPGLREVLSKEASRNKDRALILTILYSSADGRLTTDVRPKRPTL